MSKITKHFRMVMDFTVTGDDSKIPANGVHATFHGGNSTRSGDDALWKEDDDRQRRLFQAVLSNKQSLRQFMEVEIATWLECSASNQWHDILFDVDELQTEQVLQPAISTLSEDDQRHFAEVEEEGVFFENTEVFHDCFETQFDTISLTQLEDGS
jgi:hypothetical protein